MTSACFSRCLTLKGVFSSPTSRGLLCNTGLSSALNIVSKVSLQALPYRQDAGNVRVEDNVQLLLLESSQHWYTHYREGGTLEDVPPLVEVHKDAHCLPGPVSHQDLVAQP